MRSRTHDRLELRLDPMLRLAIDDWRRRQPDQPSRDEAVRRLLERGLDSDATHGQATDAPSVKAT